MSRQVEVGTRFVTESAENIPGLCHRSSRKVFLKCKYQRKGRIGGRREEGGGRERGERREDKKRPKEGKEGEDNNRYVFVWEEQLS